ncbi:VWA domain-containing protein [Nitrosopumilus sp. S6]
MKRYLLTINPQIAEELLKIEYENNKVNNEDVGNHKKGLNLGTKIADQIKEEMHKEVLLCFDDQHKKQVVNWAEKLYKNRTSVQNKNPFYYETHDSKQLLQIKKNNLVIHPTGEFKHKVNKLNFLYLEEHERIRKVIRRIRKDLVGLNFDTVTVPNEDIQSYFKLKEENHKLIKKIREQIRMVLNNTENPQTNFYGEIDMELAIQAIASNTQQYAEVFDKNEEQRIEESWAILVDNSASMKLRFKQVKDFMLCMAEASDELTGAAGVWGLFSFDQKFSILKDFKGNYNQDVRARIGGLKSGGLSFTPDAIILAGRTLMKNPADIKHLFVFTDDFPTGLWNFDKKLYLAIKEVERMGIEVIGIGLSPNISKYFSDFCYGSDIRELTSKFIRIYRMKSVKNL